MAAAEPDKGGLVSAPAPHGMRHRAAEHTRSRAHAAHRQARADARRYLWYAPTRKTHSLSLAAVISRLAGLAGGLPMGSGEMGLRGDGATCSPCCGLRDRWMGRGAGAVR